MEILNYKSNTSTTTTTGTPEPSHSGSYYKYIKKAHYKISESKLLEILLFFTKERKRPIAFILDLG